MAMNNSSDASHGLPPTTYFYSALSLLGLLLNLFIIVIVCARRTVPGRIPRAFLVNQEISDCLCCLLRGFSFLTDQDFTVPENAFGTFVYRLMFPKTLYWSLIHAACNNQILFTIEQYVSVVHPLKHSKFGNKFVMTFFIALCWLLGFGYETGAYFEASREANRCVQVNIASYLFYVIPFGVMAFCYSQMIFALKRQMRKMLNHSSSSAAASASAPPATVNPNVAIRKQIQRELSYSVCIMGLAFLVLFAPNAITYYAYCLGLDIVEYGSWFYELTVFFVNIYFVVNPLIYMTRMKSFRREFLKIFCCRAKQSQGQTLAVSEAWKKDESSAIVSHATEVTQDNRYSTLNTPTTDISIDASSIPISHQSAASRLQPAVCSQPSAAINRTAADRREGSL